MPTRIRPNSAAGLWGWSSQAAQFDVAASLGIAESCLHRWRHPDLVYRGLKPGATAQESAALVSCA